MHHDLITSLSHFTSALQNHRTETGDMEHGSRTKILEQSLIQQNQVVETLQKMVGSLEMENKRVRERAAGLEQQVQALKMWKMRGRLAEQRLKEMADSSGILGSSQSGIISLSALATFEKMIVERDAKIATLQSLSLGQEEKEDDDSVPLRAKLVAKTVRVLELEEELLACREESSRAQRELADCQSDIARKESELQYLRHEAETGRRTEAQQQDVVMGLRTALLDRDAQIASLMRALEQVSTDRERKKTAPIRSSETLFNLLLRREVFNIELTRASEQSQPDITVRVFEMPISSRTSSVIVTSVREGGPAHDLLLPGDEILEVNGLNCRSAGSQRKAVEALERSKGTLKIVAARDHTPTGYVGRLRSTPLTSETSGSSSLWTTARDTSFSPLTLPPVTHNDSSHHYQLSLSTSPGSAPPYTVPLASRIRPQPIGQQILEAGSPEGLVKSGRGGETDSEDEAVLRERQAELEEELDTAQRELEKLKNEHQLITAESQTLQQQVKANERGITDIRTEKDDLEQVLAGVRGKLEREEERYRELSEQVSSLQTKLSEACSARDMEKHRASQAQEEAVNLKMEWEKEKSRLLSDIAAVTSRTDQLESEVKGLSSQLQAAQSQARELESEREREKREGEQVAQQLTTELQGVREQLAREVTSLQTEADRLTHQLASTTTQLQASEEKEAETKVELRQLRQAVDEGNKQLSELDASQRKLREKMAIIREEAESRTVQCESLTLGMKRAEGKLQANRDLTTRQQEEIDNLRRNNKKMLVERVRADEERSKAEVALRICRSELAQVKEQLQSQSGERDLFSELETLVTENTALQQQLEGSGEAEKLSQEMEQLQSQLDCARKELQETSSERDNLKSELALQRSRKEELSQSLRAAETALQAAEAGRKKTDDLLSSMMFVHEQDQGKIKELEETVATAQGGLQEIRVEATRVQQEMGRELQQLGSECSGLRERVRSLSEQLDREKDARASEVKSLKESLQSSEQSVSHLQTELQARESANGINQATIAQLQTICEQTEQEKLRLEAGLEERLQQTHKIQNEVEELRKKVRELESENSQLAGECQSLHKSSAELQSSVTESERQTELLTARLESAQTELSLKQQKLDENETEICELKTNLTELEKKLHESERQRTGSESRAQEITLSLHSREEEVSRLKSELEMTTSESSQLQSSVALLQTTATTRDKKMKILEGERANLLSAVEQLKASQEKMKGVVASLESEKAHVEKQKAKELEPLKQELEEKREKEKEQEAKVRQLERRCAESQRTAEELLAAQEALRSSLTALGDEREGEVVRLRQQLVSLEASLVSSQQEAFQSKTRADELRDQLSTAVEECQEKAGRCSELQDELESLRETVEQLRETEKGLADLQLKVSVLENSQRERNSKMVAMESDLETTSRELQSTKAENAALLERVGEMAAANLALTETSTELERVRGELAAEVRGRREVVEEKEQLLGVLRRLEVERHTTHTTTPDTPSSWEEADREELVGVAREREEEAMRLREYVAKLLSAVVEKAPFVLERIE